MVAVLFNSVKFVSFGPLICINCSQFRAGRNRAFSYLSEAVAVVFI